ncbi:rhomboid family intramembrane serine protease [Ascidiimonas sp. W6]|uniref:rhomboid family intramembrane serine protease n=1 Tax=Ascidiimonas meishanensis TaxID=3128903 RepID=UPI0030ED99FB
MKRAPNFKFSNEVILVPFFTVLLLWIIYWFEFKFGFDFTKYGIYPRSLSGLRGVILSPFIHSSVKHLYNNSFPTLILMSALLYFYRTISLKVLVVGWLLSGLLTWIMAREAYHIGISGMIYLLSSFIFFKGIFTKYYRLIAVSLIVVFIYGSLVWYLFPVDDRISWEGHLSGFLVGFVLALLFRNKVEIKEAANEESLFYEKDDPFLKHFDEDGNFIPTSELEKLDQEEELE